MYIWNFLQYNVFAPQKLVAMTFEVTLLDKMFSCGRTKATTITLNVLGPFVHQRTVDGMKESGYFSVSSSVSNMRNIKLIHVQSSTLAQKMECDRRY
jgi:hypothetical protein